MCLFEYLHLLVVENITKYQTLGLLYQAGKKYDINIIQI